MAARVMIRPSPQAGAGGLERDSAAAAAGGGPGIVVVVLHNPRRHRSNVRDRGSMAERGSEMREMDREGRCGEMAWNEA